MQLIRKISAKSIMGNVKKLALDTFYLNNDTAKPNPEAPTEYILYTLLGIVKGLKTGTGDNGEWISFEGDFKATRFIDGEIFRGPRAFISEPAQSMLETALGENDTLEMAFKVSIVPSNNAYGYEYRTSPLIDPKENDAIAALENMLGDKLKLPAPQTVAPKASAPKPKAKKK